MHVIMASTSKVFGKPYLSYLEEPLTELYKNVQEILFIPFARPGGISHQEYTKKAQEGLAFLGKKVTGLHEKDNYKTAIKTADAIFTGGGNTFLLTSKLYEYDLIEVLQNTLKMGTPYLGTSAGSVICGLSMKTTNDMPIVYPPSFKTLGIVPFHLNAHYLDPDPQSKHQGETRETRIKEFQNLNASAVVGLREGSWLEVTSQDIILKGNLSARIFEPQKEAYEIAPNSSLKQLH